MMSPSPEFRIAIDRLQARLADAQPDFVVVEECGTELATMGSDITAAIVAEATVLLAASQPNAA